MMLAYIDPGSGSFLLQVLLAGLLSAIYTVRHWIAGVWARLTRRKPKPPSDDTAT